MSRTLRPRRCAVMLAVLVGGLAVLFGGCGSGAATTTTTPAQTAAASPQPPASAPAAVTTAQPQAYPVVPFTLVSTGTTASRWPFTAQLARVTENPNGFSGAGEPPQDTYLMVQVDVTSQITGRLVPAPKLTVSCRAPGERGWQPGPVPATGYDEGAGSTPDPGGNRIALGDGQPHPWDVEWQVPIGTSTANVRCTLRPDPPQSYADYPVPHVVVAGSGKLN